VTLRVVAARARRWCCWAARWGRPLVGEPRYAKERKRIKKDLDTSILTLELIFNTVREALLY
jgi:hypothetical protein